MFATLRVTAEILSTFTCTSRTSALPEPKLLATHFQASHAAFAAPILAKSKSGRIVEPARPEV